MRRLIAVLILSACVQQPAAPPSPTEIRTVENTPITAIPVQHPPTLDQPAMLGPAGPATKGTEKLSDKQDELSRKMNLPFAPAIAMDPVDGSKVSITPDTPVAEHKERLYYFSSAKNRQAFLANPTTYVEGKLSSY